MTSKRLSLLILGTAALLFTGTLTYGAPVSVPAEDEEAATAQAPAAGGHLFNATGGYQFVIPADFNGGIFGTEGPIYNRVTFTARRDPDGSVSGWFTYEQEADGNVARISGPITCFNVYDTPVLVRTPEIPPRTQNRAKWGGRINISNDPSLIGIFAWFQSIDNGEGANGYSDVSTLLGIGNEAANEAFCAIDRVPNPNFGPHRIGEGNIQIH